MTAETPGPPAPGIRAVVVNWNAAAMTSRCVRALQASHPVAPGIIVVDNGSDDGSAASLRAAYPGVCVIESGRNGGFAAGCNLGIAHARREGARWVWLVNNDAEPRPSALDALVRAGESDARVAAVGSVLVDPDDDAIVHVWGGGWIDHRLGRAGHYRREVAVPARGCDYLVGASLLLRMAALDPVRPLDDGFFLYWEDGDLCARLRADGWRLAVAAGAVVRHRAHGSLDARDPWFDLHYHASAVRFFRRHGPAGAWPMLIGATARSLRHVIHARWQHVGAIWRGTRRGWQDVAS